MNRFPTYMSSMATILLIAALAVAEPPRILPVGDSITHGYWSGIGANHYNSYRKMLKTLLEEQGYAIDFVGSLSDGDFADPQHEGHDGWYAGHDTASNNVLDHVAGWVTNHLADLVLLHIGTNDIIHNNADSTVILALIINALPSSGKTNAISAYNADLLAMAETRIAAGDDLVVMDMEAALDNAWPDLNDTWHPTQPGYDKMATNWVPAVKAALIRRAGPPFIENIEVSGDTIELALANLPTGRVVNVETATNLTSNGWSTADSFIPTTSTTNWSGSASPTNAFHRAVIHYP